MILLSSSGPDSVQVHSAHVLCIEIGITSSIVCVTVSDELISSSVEAPRVVAAAVVYSAAILSDATSPSRIRGIEAIFDDE